jgi:hypothetical protein
MSNRIYENKEDCINKKDDPYSVLDDKIKKKIDEYSVKNDGIKKKDDQFSVSGDKIKKKKNPYNPASLNFILQEDSFFILDENGFEILLEGEETSRTTYGRIKPFSIKENSIKKKI